MGCLKFFHINDEKRLYLLARTIKKHYFCGMKMITILGPTASGKTDIAAHLAYELGAEIISADSRQVYRGMDIGTGKDLEDYIVNGTPVPYHLIDICDAGAKYNLFQYQEDFLRAYDDITSRGVQPILCGGTGLYIESVLKGYHLSPVPQNPELRASLEGKSLEELTVMLKELKAKAGSNMHNKTDVDSCQRAIRAIEIESYNLENPIPVRDFPAIDSIIIGVNIDRDERSYDDMFRGLEIAIHQFAKRQMTWFRGMERRGFKIHWIDAMLPMDEKVKAIKELIK